MVLFVVDKKWLRKKEKGHLAGHDMMRCITCHNTAFQNGRQTIMNNHAYKMYL